MVLQPNHICPILNVNVQCIAQMSPHFKIGEQNFVYKVDIFRLTRSIFTVIYSAPKFSSSFTIFKLLDSSVMDKFAFLPFFCPRIRKVTDENGKVGTVKLY